MQRSGHRRATALEHVDRQGVAWQRLASQAQRGRAAQRAGRGRLHGQQRREAGLRRQVQAAQRGAGHRPFAPPQHGGATAGAHRLLDGPGGIGRRLRRQTQQPRAVQAERLQRAQARPARWSDPDHLPRGVLALPQAAQPRRQQRQLAAGRQGQQFGQAARRPAAARQLLVERLPSGGKGRQRRPGQRTGPPQRCPGAVHEGGQPAWWRRRGGGGEVGKHGGGADGDEYCT